MFDKRQTKNKPFLILSSLAHDPRWKPYSMSKLRQQGSEWTITGRKKPIIKSIQESFIGKGFINAQLKPNILINAIMHNKET